MKCLHICRATCSYMCVHVGMYVDLISKRKVDVLHDDMYMYMRMCASTHSLQVVVVLYFSTHFELCRHILLDIEKRWISSITLSRHLAIYYISTCRELQCRRSTSYMYLERYMY
jgi:hypothetical protein